MQYGFVVPHARYTTRLACLADAAAVLGIEERAAARFSEIGMREIAEGVGLTVAHYERFVEIGAVFLTSCDDEPVAFIAACPVDGACHVAELDVLPEHAGKRLGSRLIDAAEAWAAQQGASCLTLTTFRDVPWNAPYYARLGFREVRVDAFGLGHREIWEGQRAMGLDMSARVLMMRPLGQLQRSQ